MTSRVPKILFFVSIMIHEYCLLRYSNPPLDSLGSLIQRPNSISSSVVKQRRNSTRFVMGQEGMIKERDLRKNKSCVGRGGGAKK